MVKVIVKNMKIEDIVPYGNNPRKNEEAIDFVANSIRDFGFKVPIVVDKNNVIVTGHTRWHAANRLGLKEVPVIVADDLSESQIKAFRIADNKVGEIASWDLTKLGDEIKDLDIDFTDYGFSDFELNLLKDGVGFDEDAFDEMFKENEPTEKAPSKKNTKRIQCPLCGEWFAVDDAEIK